MFHLLKGHLIDTLKLKEGDLKSKRRKEIKGPATGGIQSANPQPLD